MSPLTTVLLDLDGVIRHFDQAHLATVEANHGLAAGTILQTAFAPKLLQPVITGRMGRTAWAEEVGRRIGVMDAAMDWMAAPGTTDGEMLAEVDTLRAAGVVVAILTNGTDAIPAEMRDLGLDVRFDAIFNSADIGVAKPDRRVFQAVCDALAVEPAEVFFTDDSASKLAGAVELGMAARLFEGVESFRDQLKELGFRAS